MPVAKVEARRLEHKALEADDDLGVGVEERVVGLELLGGRKFGVCGGAEDFFGFLERVFDLAAGEEGGGCGILRADVSKGWKDLRRRRLT